MVYRVLIIDDNQSNITKILNQFKNCHISNMTCQGLLYDSNIDFINEINDYSPHIVFLTCNIPLPQYQSIVKKVKSLHPYLGEVILLHSLKDKQVPLEFFEKGISGCLNTDEINHDALNKAIQKPLHNIQLQKSLEDSNHRIDYMSKHDSLTHLLNREQFKEELKSLIDKSETDVIAVMMIDLDNFKNTNYFFGHEMGDKILIDLSKQLKSLLSSKDIIARFGGDEFLIASPKNTAEEVRKLSSQIYHKIKEGFSYQGTFIDLSASIGVSIYPEHGENTRDLIRHADMSMYHAKKTLSQIFIFDPILQVAANNHSLIQNSIRQSIENDELLLNFQPIIDLKTSKISHHEVLIRWPRSPILDINIDQLIDICSSSDLIYLLTQWVFNQSFQLCRTFPELKLSINITAKDMNNLDLIKNLCEQSKSIMPGQIEIEITEISQVGHFESFPEGLKLLKSHFKLALDDFGKGLSTFKQLKKLMPINTIKIDKSFIRNIEKDNHDIPIVKSIIELSHNIQSRCVAEGIESREQLELLKEMGCDYGQGFLLNKPYDISQLKIYLSTLKKN